MQGLSQLIELLCFHVLRTERAPSLRDNALDLLVLVTAERLRLDLQLAPLSQLLHQIESGFIDPSPRAKGASIHRQTCLLITKVLIVYDVYLVAESCCLRSIIAPIHLSLLFHEGLGARKARPSVLLRHCQALAHSLVAAARASTALACPHKVPLAVRRTLCLTRPMLRVLLLLLGLVAGQHCRLLALPVVQSLRIQIQIPVFKCNAIPGGESRRFL
mmetsp:Transcript_25670/g.32002  ORF Transcript_25670/g.32002 Transcript_25670/m.32002 type:complete len:217 (-) Transcript_25670:27-677(-)